MAVAEQRAGVRIEGDATSLVAASAQGRQAMLDLQAATQVSQAGQQQAAATADRLQRAIREGAAANEQAGQSTVTVTQANTAASKLAEDAIKKAQQASQAQQATLKSVQDEMQRTAEAHKKLQASQQATNEVQRVGGITAGQYNQAMRQLPAQITDIISGLTTGQAPMTVAIQQGGQLRDSFGGFGNMLRGVSSLISPTLVGMAVLAGTVGGAAVAIKQGHEESAVLNKQLALMGPTAVMSAGQVRAAEDAISAGAKIAIGNVRELGAEVLKTAVGGAAYGEGLRAAAAIQKLTGASAAEAAKAVSGAGENALDFAAKANKAYGFLTAAQVEQVRQLQVQGRAAEATRLVLTELAATLEQRTTPAVGLLERTLDSGASAWSKFWDSVKSIGRDTTAEDKLAALQQRVRDLNGPAPLKNESFVSRYTSLFSSFQNQDGGQSALEGMRRQAAADEAGFREQFNRDALRRSEQVAATISANDEIEKLQAAHQAALAAQDKSAAAVRLSQINLQLTRQEEATKLAFQHAEVGAQEHQKKLLDIELRRLDSQLANVNGLAGIEARRRPTTETGRQEQQAAVDAFQAQRNAIEERRLRLLGDEAAGRRDITPKVTSGALGLNEGPNGDVGMNSGDLLKSTRAQEAEAGEEAYRAHVRETYERQKALAAEAAQFRLDKERQFVDDVKPQWERMIDAWGSANQRMKDGFDRTVTAALQAGEDAWIKFSQTGKLSVKNLVDSIAAETSRTAYRNFVSAAANYFGGRSTAVSNASGEFDLKNSVSNNTGESGFKNPSSAAVDFESRVATSSQSTGRASALGATSTSAGSSVGTGMTLELTIVNQTGTPMQGTATQRSDGGLELLLTAVEERIAGNVANGVGSVTQALQSRFNLRATVG